MFFSLNNISNNKKKEIEKYIKEINFDLITLINIY
tara:strand:+ start:51 stop:155 length:105 start_codon:yes stop_codon:yes gene_type:complete